MMSETGPLQSGEEAPKRVFAITVAFHPKREELEALCRAVRGAGAAAIVVDNTPGSPIPGFDLSGAVVVSLGDNTGIAHALNVGIERARAEGGEIVVLFDQDSEVEDGFLAALVAPLRRGIPGVTAPVALDKRTGIEYPSHRLNAIGLPKPVFSRDATAPVPVDLVITSGSAATMETFSVVGGMDEDFFIDFVDYEWCLRCRKAGVPIHVVPSAVMPHAVGDANVTIGPLRGIVHGPARTYYKIRNCFLLLRKRHVPLAFATLELLSGLVHNLAQVAVVERKGLYLRTFAAAVAQGVRGERGKRLST
jgi:rhamnosyltransferase